MRVYKDGDYIRYLECDPCGTPEKKAKPPADADRIAAAVAVLHEANKDADIIEELSRSRGTDPTTLILRLFGAGINLSELSAKALAILEGRAET